MHDRCNVMDVFVIRINHIVVTSRSLPHVSIADLSTVVSTVDIASLQ